MNVLIFAIVFVFWLTAGILWSVSLWRRERTHIRVLGEMRAMLAGYGDDGPRSLVKAVAAAQESLWKTQGEANTEFAGRLDMLNQVLVEGVFFVVDTTIKHNENGHAEVEMRMRRRDDPEPGTVTGKVSVN